jgi:hypothetical protein
LLQIVHTFSSFSQFSGSIQRWEQHGSQDRYDRDHHEQFNESENLPVHIKLLALSVIVYIH